LIPFLSLGGVVAGPVYYTPRGDIEGHQESGLHPRYPIRQPIELHPFFVSFVLFVVNSLIRPVRTGIRTHYPGLSALWTRQAGETTRSLFEKLRWVTDPGLSDERARADACYINVGDSRATSGARPDATKERRKARRKKRKAQRYEYDFCSSRSVGSCAQRCLFVAAEPVSAGRGLV